ncbi:MAG: YkgJ family cysteine cluster protein [Pyrinomonadaceae bacterium]
MSDDSHEFAELMRVFKDLDFDAVCENCMGRCCHLPWLSKEEIYLAHQFPGSTKFIGETAFFMDHNRCVFLDQKGKCSIYAQRPLDCRLFPLDIIEEDGEYYWCVFTTCPNWQKMKELFEPLIPALEKKINSSLWHQFLKQIEVTKEEYLPYKSGQYVTIRRFNRNFS